MPIKRVWEEQEIGVYVYHFQHPDGAIILILNLGQYTYEEQLTMDLKNLLIENSKED